MFVLAGNESATERRERLRTFIGMFVYESMRDVTDPAWDGLPTSEREEFYREARRAQRGSDPVARQVAEEMAAQAYATANGWDWPSLFGHPINPLQDRELQLSAARQKIRKFARDMVRAYEKHLEDGGSERVPHLEESFLQTVREQNKVDRALHEAKPMPARVTRLIERKQ